MQQRKIVKPRPVSKSPIRAAHATPADKLQLILRIRPTLSEEDPESVVQQEDVPC